MILTFCGLLMTGRHIPRPCHGRDLMGPTIQHYKDDEFQWLSWAQQRGVIDVFKYFQHHIKAWIFGCEFAISVSKYVSSPHTFPVGVNNDGFYSNVRGFLIASTQIDRQASHRPRILLVNCPGFRLRVRWLWRPSRRFCSGSACRHSLDNSKSCIPTDMPTRSAFQHDGTFLGSTLPIYRMVSVLSSTDVKDESILSSDSFYRFSTSQLTLVHVLRCLWLSSLRHLTFRRPLFTWQFQTHLLCDDLELYRRLKFTSF